MSAMVPTLSSKGWVSGVTEKLDFLLSWFLVTNYSQTNVFYTKMASLPWLCATYGRDRMALANETESVLKDYLDKYFDEVDVKCTTRDQDIERPDNGKYNLVMEIVVYSNGMKYDVTHAFEIINSKFKKLIEGNNG